MKSFFLILLFSLQALAADNSALIRNLAEQSRLTGSDSLILVENDRVIYENHFGHVEKVQSVQSVTKSISSIAIGILIDQGKIQSLDEPMSTWIPSWKTDSQKSLITLRMIMNHTSGYPDVDGDFFNRYQNDLIEGALQTDLVAEPGSAYLYSSIATLLLQVVIEKASGQSVESFVDQFLFRPLGITEWKWNKDGAGHAQTAGGLYLKSSDMVKIGLMMLHQGMDRGQRILSEKMQQLLVTKTETYFDYGHLWWLYGAQDVNHNTFRVFSAYGWGGQFISVFPEKNLVAIRTRDPVTINPSNLLYEGFPKFPELITQWQ